MSATNRGTIRRKHDYYATPSWPTRLLVENVSLPDGHWLEPTAGDGAIIRAVNTGRQDIDWSYCEIRKECKAVLEKMCRRGELVRDVARARFHGSCGVIGDFLTTPLLNQHYDVVISNPPFTIAQEVIERAVEIAPKALIVMLLRLNFLESDRRAEWLAQHAPDVYVLPNRPSFARNKHGKRATDATAYAWMIWDGAKKRKHGKVSVLPAVARADRLLSELEVLDS